MSETSDLSKADEGENIFHYGREKKVGSKDKTAVALVYGTIPSLEELEQYTLFMESCEFTLVTAKPIADYVERVSYFQDLNIVGLPDHEENPSFLPGLERALAGFDVVIVKERVGLYSYQAVKAKWLHNFKLYVAIDNITPFPGEDIRHMKTIREEVTNTADGLMVQSKLVKNMLITVEGVDPSRILYITPHVTPRKNMKSHAKSDALESLQLHDRDFLVSCFGQIEWEEGLLDIIHALKHVHEKEGEYCKVKLAICGVGSFDQDIIDRVRALGIQHAVRVVDPSREAVQCLLNASDLVFASSVQSRDRLEGDPFRLLLATANGIPILSGRTPLVEEILGKHRIDFCVGSPRSISEAILRAKDAKVLIANIKSKNLNTVERNHNVELFKEDFLSLLDHSNFVSEDGEILKIVRQVNEVEKLVNNKRYLDAISMVERLFGEVDLPVHHQANLYRLIGDSFAKLQDNKSAKESYAHALELDPFLSKAHLGYGAMHLSESNYNGSVLAFQKAISYAPQDDMANLGLGLSFQGLGEKVEARKWILSALECNPANELAVFSLVRISNETGDFEGCEETLNLYLKLKPNQPDMQFTLAGILFKLKKFTRSKMLCESILKAEPTHDKARDLYDLVLGELEAKKQNVKSA